MKLPVYLDHAATTPVAPEVLDAMMPYFRERPWNASSRHSGGAEAAEAVARAREQVAALIGASPREIFFTSGATEANNWALKALPKPAGAARPRALISAFEHPSVIETAETLARMGWELDFIPVTPDGVVEPEDVEKRILDGTAFVSVMLANNEVGTIQPIKEIGRLCRARSVPLHVDAVQAVGWMPVDVRELHADLLVLSSHKIYGPKGVGALYVREGTFLGRWMDGGSQERSMRAGTLNVPGIVGFGAACALVAERRDEDAARVGRLRDQLCRGVLEHVGNAHVTCETSSRLPHFAHMCFRGVEGDAILTGLDATGIYASAGSACSAGSVRTSHVLRALGLPEEWARGAVRMTLGRETTEEQIAYVVAAVAEVLAELSK